jgi:hypothetical protein
MAIDADAPRSRRSIIAAALGGAGALIAASLGRAAPVAAADGDPVLLGQGTTSTENAATAVTVVNSSVDGIRGVSAATTGLFGRSAAPGASNVDGHGTGVIGATGDGTSIAARTNQTGVYGFADDSNAAAGVWGDTVQGTGVVGTGAWGVYGTGDIGIVGDVGGAGTGVYGFTGDVPLVVPPPSTGVAGIAVQNGGVGVRGHASSGTATGVLASAATTGQIALAVSGKLKLSRSGRVSIGATSSSRKITMAGVTTSSYVIATVQTSVTGLYVRAVVPTTGAFTIYLSKAPGKTVYVGFVVIN